MGKDVIFGFMEGNMKFGMFNFDCFCIEGFIFNCFWVNLICFFIWVFILIGRYGYCIGVKWAGDFLLIIEKLLY